MADFKKILISPLTPIQQTMKIIEAASMQIALVVDENGRLLGTVTDGDIRRGILKDISLDQPVQEIMKAAPTTAKRTDDKKHILNIMKSKKIHQVPIVDENGCVIDLEILGELIKPQPKENGVVLMAGGLGTRLRPLTYECPKPMLKVGNKPILETILENLIDHGFRKFYFSVNYMSKVIEDYFGDGSKWGVTIQYIHEDKRLGTAGSLSLLPQKPEQPILVMNSDIITKINFQELLDFHEEHKAQATLCVREYEFQVPYGVVYADEQRLVKIEEKPSYHFFVSAGIYVIEPDALDLIPKNSYFDMPSLFEKLLEHKQNANIFPIREYWIDIGRMDDFKRANLEFKGENFG